MFPGQRAQAVRMHRNLAQHVLSAGALLDLVDGSLADGVRPPRALCFGAPKSESTATTNTQLAMLPARIGSLRGPQSAPPSRRPVLGAGRSSGQYTPVLVAADAALVPSLLVRRVACLVSWRKGLEVIVAAGVTTFPEGRSGRMGPGPGERAHKGLRAFAVSDRASPDGMVAAWMRHGREAADV